MTTFSFLKLIGKLVRGTNGRRTLRSTQKFGDACQPLGIGKVMLLLLLDLWMLLATLKAMHCRFLSVILLRIKPRFAGSKGVKAGTYLEAADGYC